MQASSGSTVASDKMDRETELEAPIERTEQIEAVVVHGAKDLRVEMIRSPDGDVGPDQVSVRIERGGICGSDLHYYADGGFGTVRLREPMILGHEVAGIIERVGANVERLRAGDRVAISPSRPCGTCAYCQSRQQTHCMDMRFYGSAMRFPHIQGAFRQRVVADESQCHTVLPSLSASEAALAEPLAVALHAVNRAGSLVGRRILITGSGPIGVLCAVAARRAGAAEIVATDIAAAPLKVMGRVGADVVINHSERPDALNTYGVGKGTFDVLFEASGNAQALASAFDVLKPGATIVQIGLGAAQALPLNTIVAKEFDLRGTFRFHEEFATAVDFMNKGLVDVQPLITQTLPYKQARAAFDLAGDRTQAMKVQLAF